MNSSKSSSVKSSKPKPKSRPKTRSKSTKARPKAKKPFASPSSPPRAKHPDLFYRCDQVDGTLALIKSVLEKYRWAICGNASTVSEFARHILSDGDGATLEDLREALYLNPDSMLSILGHGSEVEHFVNSISLAMDNIDRRAPAAPIFSPVKVSEVLCPATPDGTSTTLVSTPAAPTVKKPMAKRTKPRHILTDDDDDSSDDHDRERISLLDSDDSDDYEADSFVPSQQDLDFIVHNNSSPSSYSPSSPEICCSSDILQPPVRTRSQKERDPHENVFLSLKRTPVVDRHTRARTKKKLSAPVLSFDSSDDDMGPTLSQPRVRANEETKLVNQAVKKLIEMSVDDATNDTSTSPTPSAFAPFRRPLSPPPPRKRRRRIDSLSVKHTLVHPDTSMNALKRTETDPLPARLTPPLPTQLKKRPKYL